MITLEILGLLFLLQRNLHFYTLFLGSSCVKIHLKTCKTTVNKYYQINHTTNQLFMYSKGVALDKATGILLYL